MSYNSVFVIFTVQVKILYEPADSNRSIYGDNSFHRFRKETANVFPVKERAVEKDETETETRRLVRSREDENGLISVGSCVSRRTRGEIV